MSSAGTQSSRWKGLSAEQLYLQGPRQILATGLWRGPHLVAGADSTLPPASVRATVAAIAQEGPQDIIRAGELTITLLDNATPAQ